MAWRLARSLERLRAQINALAPKRSKASDGTIGDEAHKSRISDHNAWVRDGKTGVVTALDITHDPKNGVDAGKLARAISASRDPRIKYIISNGEICSSETAPWQWRKYTGTNPHTKHFHVSVKSTKAHYDSDMPWRLDGYEAVPDKDAPVVVKRPTLRRGSRGDTVRVLQRLLGITVDGDFGPKTDAAVRTFQNKAGLVADAIVGAYTWAALDGARK